MSDNKKMSKEQLQINLADFEETTFYSLSLLKNNEQ